MKAKTLVIGGLAAASGGAVVLLRRKMDPQRIHSNGAADGKAEDRWHVVTVNRPPEEVSSEGRLPDPLAELGDKIEVQTRPAPGDRGTELAARLLGHRLRSMLVLRARFVLVLRQWQHQPRHHRGDVGLPSRRDLRLLSRDGRLQGQPFSLDGPRSDIVGVNA